AWSMRERTSARSLAGSVMARCYSGPVPRLKPLPQIWLLSDARNDAGLERALRRLPRRSGFVFRHYHLPAPERRARYERLARIARSRGHMVVLAGTQAEARRWRAEGSYGLGGMLATAHSLRELRRTGRAAAVLLSPVFPTRSHPGAPALGPLRFLLMAQKARIPVLALGGMTPRRAARLLVHGWAAIDGLS
ncbi:MAG: thiamine phosphate synthase, partial [Novosphingobium sp.]